MPVTSTERKKRKEREMQNATASIDPNDIDTYVIHGYADNHGVNIHYASLGEGPLVVMIHGYPDFWYTWRNQMVALAPHFQVVALDLRGYNLSDKPQGGEQYSMRHLIGDVHAVIGHLGRDKAIIVGHDWGGAIAWQFAMHLPAQTERLIILNIPHPRGVVHELAQNPQQHENSAYARNFQQEGAHLQLIYENEAAHAQFSDPELGAEFEAYNAFTAEVQQRGVFLSSEALQPTSTATTVRVQQGKTQRSRLAACSILQRGRPVGGNGQESQQARGTARGGGAEAIFMLLPDTEVSWRVIHTDEGGNR
jgi:pimeloyl-ACP methyl ester carboxylesterase